MLPHRRGSHGDVDVPGIRPGLDQDGACLGGLSDGLRRLEPDVGRDPARRHDLGGHRDLDQAVVRDLRRHHRRAAPGEAQMGGFVRIAHERGVLLRAARARDHGPIRTGRDHADGPHAGFRPVSVQTEHEGGLLAVR